MTSTRGIKEWIGYIFCCSKTKEEGTPRTDSISIPVKATDHVSNTTESELDSFLKILLADIKPQTEEAERKDIYQSVEKTVLYLLDKLAIVEPFLKSSEIIETGSCYDGTKILELDEFDFLAIIDCLSSDNVVIATPSLKCEAAGFAHAISQDRMQNLPCITHENTVFACRKSISLREMFRSHFHSVLQDEISDKFNLKMSTGTLVLGGFAVAINGPQCSVRVKWRPNNVSSKELEIDIDITPTIKCYDITTFLNSRDVEHDEVYELMKEDPVFYLIPRPNPVCDYCFKIVFTEVDQTLVKKMNDSHFKELMLLKYVSHEILRSNFRLKKILSSFALKMAVFHHSFNCNEANISVGECLISTLVYVIERLNTDPPSLPSVFITSRNVWKNPPLTQELSQASVTLQKVIELFVGIRDRKFKNLDFVHLREMLIDVCNYSICQGFNMSV